MCGYCIEGEAIKCLWDNQFDIDKLADVMKGKDLEYIVSEYHLFPEFVDESAALASFRERLQPNHPLSLWATLRQVILTGSISSSFYSELEEQVCAGVLQQELSHYGADIQLPIPAFSQLVSSKSLSQFLQRYSTLIPSLIEEAKCIIRQISRDFVSPFFTKGENEGGMFANMSLPTYEEDEHSAFYNLPITIFLAADILISHEPAAVELTAVSLHIYPTPAFDSTMMAWQRFIVWHWYCLNGQEGLKELGVVMRRELVLYLAIKMKCQNQSLEWLSTVVTSMRSPIVNIDSEYLMQMTKEASLNS